MKYKLLLCLNALIPSVFAINCALPCGVEELVSCAAQANNLQPEEFFSYKLYHSANIDGFCKTPLKASLKTTQQKLFFDKFCQQGEDAYLSYNNFINAASNFPTFGCEGTRDDRYKELANFLSTISEETSSRLNNYTNDGLYYRYENSALRGSSLNSRTKYFPGNGYMVALNSHNEINSQMMWYGNHLGATIMNLQSTPEHLSWGKISAPNNYKLTNLNKIVLPGYWVGMGPIQLTGGSLIEFFGWYNNHILESATQDYNVNDFVQEYMQDGEMAFSGAFWFWMVRVGGINYATLHQVVTNPNKPVCHDIGVVTRIVNGGCNGYNPGRLNYYKYFTNLFHVDIKPVTVTFHSKQHAQTLNSMECGEPIRSFCQKNN